MQNKRSVAFGHFPRIRIQDGEHLLWNPLKKQAFRQRPEERVRLQILEFLIHQSSIPTSRIATETAVPSRYSRGRTDILCHDPDFQPWLLIECKADNVKIGPKTALQSAHYNKHISAPYIMMSNGIQDILFDMSAKPVALEPSGYPPDIKPGVPFISMEPSYWSGRGFLPENMDTNAAAVLSALLCHLFHQSGESRSYLTLNVPHESKVYAHYYLLTSAPGSPDTLLAFTVMAAGPGDAVIVAAGNRRKKITGLLTIAIDQSGSFHSPELIMAENDNIITPDISLVERICLEPSSAQAGKPAENMIPKLARALEELLLPGK